MPDDDPNVATEPAEKPADDGKAPTIKIDGVETPSYDIADPADRARLKGHNLKVIEQEAPQLHQQLVDYQPLSKLVVEDGSPDVVFEGQYFYSKDYDNYITRQLQGYWREPKRLLLSPVQPEGCDDTAGQFLHDVLKAADKKGVQLHKNPVTEDSYFLFIFGLGLGGHILELMERTNCHAVFIAEPNPEFAYHSLEVFDWEPLFKTMEKRRGRIDIFINNNANTMAVAVRRWLRSTSPINVDGATYYHHYSNPIFTSAMNTLNSEANLILAGLGFFYDETLMLQNTHGNLYSGEERVYMRPKEPLLDIPVFVIGNGPSIDKDMAVIKANADKAILISSGSALRPLMKNGVVPDFQMETENVEVFPLISQVAKDYDLSSINLVTSSTVDPLVLPFFDRILYYFRGSLSPYPIFCDTFERCLINPNPTVVNASMSLAQEVGFRIFYIFGADMGVKAGELHHSKDAYHYTKGAKFRKDVYDKPVPANFGGQSMTSSGLFWTLDALANAVKQFSLGRQYYNCSDGAFIEGTIPYPSKSLDLNEIPAEKKQAVIDRIINNFPVYDREEFDDHWDDEIIVGAMHDYLDKVRAILDQAGDFSEKGYVSELMKLLDPKVETTRGIIGSAVTFRGTIFMMLIAFEYYLSRIAGDEDRGTYAAIAKKEMANVFKYFHETADKEFGSLSNDAEKRLAEAE